MTDKKVSGAATNYLMDAAQMVVHLRRDLDTLQWLFCYGNITMQGCSQSARKHGKQLLRSLELFEHCLEHEDGKVVKLDPKRHEQL